MNQMEDYIISAEKKWLDKLSDYCKILFSDTHIPSHDHTHHLRVWEYAKEIIQALSKSNKIDEELIESCLIASLFHDTGLAKTLEENHGHESRKICELYFKENRISKPVNFEEILSAIEMHDDKNYKNSENVKPDSVLTILFCADDLDAFGKVGVIRYTEIYLLRGIKLVELPNLVIKNLDKRFLNFEKNYKDFSDLYLKHKERYLFTRNFFEALQVEL
ncbi:MAG TPA: hypothetical protein DCG75_17105 [Bacteroidales bacterium]|nr:hypothetical protein [Bacteroidales bacterium]